MRAVEHPIRSTESVGLEVEMFPMWDDGRRLRISESAAYLCDLEELDGPDPSFRIPSGKITFEPGGQIELSAEPSVSISKSIDAQITAWQTIDELMPGRSVFTGLDLWNDVASVPLQLQAPRYSAMHRYFARQWSVGRSMMRHSCSVQINLDGGGPRMSQRVRVAEHLAPAIIASFSTSPAGQSASGRGRVWQQLDPSRTGFLPADADLSEAVYQKAMSAGVLVVRHEGEWHPGPDGLTFCEWDQNGHSPWGRPSDDDLRYHLSTLFTEVRPRNGTLEIRTPDAVPLRYLSALVTLVASIVYSDSAGAELLEVVPRNDLSALSVEAAEKGTEEPRVAEIARRTWRLALHAAQTNPGVDPSHLAEAAEFVERVVERKSSLSLELRQAMGIDADKALDWASAT